jgi:DNA-binding CsgD family transcriptional regulator/catechol 2,3-dioxygenase-like lactoylglutathione lyase family enzyme
MAKPEKPGRPSYPDVLTPAEWRVVEAVRHGLTNPMIARRQGVSVDAVKFHVASALQKLGFAGRAELRRWDGVRRGSLLSRQERSTTTDIKLGPVGQVARSVKDIAAASRFFGEVLGIEPLYAFGNLAFFDCDGLRLFLSEGDGGAADSILYFCVEDVRSAHEGLSRRGVEFINAPHMIHRHEDGTEEWMAFFNDNEGRPLGIMSKSVPSSAP